MRTSKDTRGKSWFNLINELEGQLDITVNYPGTVRAFHYHNYMNEWMFVVKGEFKFVLAKITELNAEEEYDYEKEVVYLSQGEIIKIEPCTWHGYQALGNQEGVIMEYGEKKFNVKNPDDLRKPYDAFDKWEKDKK